MKEKIIDKTKIQCVQGDITKQPDIESIVNAANAWLQPGGGVCGAIHKAAGPDLEKECKNYAPINVGSAIITKGYNLPNKYVIHCLGPRYGIDKPEDKLLSDCYINALNLAEKNKISSIAFPAISTGTFGYPIEKATEIVFFTLKNITKNLRNIILIRFVLFTKEDYEIYSKFLEKL